MKMRKSVYFYKKKNLLENAFADKTMAKNKIILCGDISNVPMFDVLLLMFC